MNTVEFPNLNLKFEVNRFISVFGVDIAWYAIIIAIGFVLAAIYGLRRMKEFGLDSDRTIDVILAGMVGGIIGARIYYVIFSWDLYKDDLLSIFDVRNGGLAIYGGIIGALALGLTMCKIRGVKILPMLDITALGFLIGQCIGRWGNFVNVEAYGAQTSSDYILGMTSNAIADGPVHPCFLYESVWCLIGFILLHLYSKRRKFDGEVALMYLVWYGAGRMVIEGLRQDSLYIGNFRVSQVLSGILLIFGLIMILVIRSKIKQNNDPEYLKLYVYTEESKKMLELAELHEKDPKAYKEQEKARKEALKAEKLAKKEQKMAEKAKKNETESPDVDHLEKEEPQETQSNVAEAAEEEKQEEVHTDSPDDTQLSEEIKSE
jgi:phosphatidylglycerol:prolipoprotein diacylglycerol transferase